MQDCLLVILYLYHSELRDFVEIRVVVLDSTLLLLLQLLLDIDIRLAEVLTSIGLLLDSQLEGLLSVCESSHAEFPLHGFLLTSSLSK